MLPVCSMQMEARAVVLPHRVRSLEGGLEGVGLSGGAASEAIVVREMMNASSK